MLNHIIAESIGKDFTRQRWYCHPCALSLENISEILEIAVSAPDYAVLELESWDIGSADNLVICVHASANAMSLRVLDLLRRH